jgi:hypothetical protein
MNKNILIAFLLVLLVFAGLYLFRRDRGAPIEAPTDENEEIVDEEEPLNNVDGETEDDTSYEDEVRSQLNNMTIDVPDLDTFVTLEGGEATFDAEAGIEGYMTLGDAYTLVRNEDSEFALIHVTISTGGSGTFDYIFAIEVTNTTLAHTGSAYLGDRIIVESVSAEPRTDGLFDVSVSMLTRLPDEPLSALPTIPTSLEFKLNSEGQFGL